MSYIGRCFLVAITLFISYCSAPPEAYVECNGVGTGYQCSVTHRRGDASINVCWSVHVSCSNNTASTGKTCQTVPPGGMSSAFIPINEMKNAELCDIAKHVEIKDLIISVL